jgi:large subunit ribosomal protein L32
MAVPKKKTSPSRRGMRRSHHRIPRISLGKCARCGASVMPHAVCDRCGHYGKLQVFADAGSDSAAT